MASLDRNQEEFTNLIEQKKSLEEEVNKLKRDSIMQRAKLIEERDNLKKEIERLKKLDPNGGAGVGESILSPSKSMISNLILSHLGKNWMIRIKRL